VIFQKVHGADTGARALSLPPGIGATGFERATIERRNFNGDYGRMLILYLIWAAILLILLYVYLNPGFTNSTQLVKRHPNREGRLSGRARKDDEIR
jgi:hypothetical protein